MRVDATSYEDASRRVARWARDGRSAYVCVATVHMAMEAFDSPAFQRVVNGADLVTPDGRPLVWALRSLGVRDATQVRGTDLTTRVVERAAREGIPIGLYGGTPDLLETFVRILEKTLPRGAGGVPDRTAVSSADARGRRSGNEGDPVLGCTHPVRGHRLSQAGEMDGGTQGTHSGGDVGCGRGVRLPYGSSAPGPWLDAGGRPGMAIQVADGSQAPVEALCQAQPEVRRAVLAAASGPYDSAESKAGSLAVAAMRRELS